MSVMSLDLPVRAVVLFFVFMFGAVFASFFTCMGERIAVGKDWIKDRSVCDACGHELGPMDLVPVFSYLFHGGKCRYCGAKIPVTCILGEIGLGLYFVICVLRFGLTVEALRCMALASLLLGLSIVDLRIYEIPDGFIIAGIFLWVITIPFISKPWLTEVKDGLLGGFVIGGGMLGLSLIFDKIIGKDSLGGGDIKLYFMTGLFLGLGAGFFNLILSCLVGLLFVVLLKQSKIPFGPAISIATAISLLCGAQIVQWYLGLFL